MKELLNYRYWFNSRPEPLWPNDDKVFMWLFGLIVLLGVVSFFSKRKNGQNPYRKIWASIFNLSWVNLLIGLILLFFSFELVPFLASRFWLIFWGIEAAIWLFFIIRDLLEIPKTLAKLAAEKQYKQYIP
jgi:hypothetical protein